jgi:beta-lactamase regulating signal transducer with metallopeptidase domain
LLVPADIIERLTPPQVEAVLAHELCHIRRCDNLTAAIQMIVEAVFWFHPLVWWIGARLVEERERACDEAVLALGSEPRDYVEAILNVLKLYVGSPPACMSSATGSDLRKRIEGILIRPIARNLGFARKLLLTTAGIAAVVTPITIGLLHTTPGQAQSPPEPASPIFYVASVKPNRSAEARGFSEYYPGGRFSATAITPLALMRLAYRLQDYQLVGVPA